MSEDAVDGRMPCAFVNHGGGPLPLLGQQPQVADFLSGYPKSLPQEPTAILIVTAHWETHKPVVSSGAQHKLLYDYGGFPPETYQYRYEAPGSPDLAEKVQSLLEAAGSPCDADGKRGWDHGVFVPLMLMFPEAKIPVVSLSVLASQNADEQMRIGEALQPLRDEGVFILGSGASFHNFRHFAAKGERQAAALAHSVAWDNWLQASLTDEELDAKGRRAQLTAWQDAPSALEAHPPGDAEHLMPLFCIIGAGGCRAGSRVGLSRTPDKFATSGFEFS